MHRYRDGLLVGLGAYLAGCGTFDLSCKNGEIDAGELCYKSGKATVLEAGDQPAALATTDLNNDGFQDLLVANFGSSDVSVFLNDGAGGFGAATNVPVDQGPNKVVTGDYNSDGNQDVAVLNSEGALIQAQDSMSVFLNAGNGQLSQPVFFGIEDQIDMETADLDVDGNPDLILAATAATTIKLVFSDGAGGFAELDVEAGISMKEVAVGDLNGDQALDLIAVDQAGAQLSVMFAFGGNNFTDPAIISTPPLPRAPSLADFDADGDLDLAVTAEDKKVALFLNKGDGSFEEPTLFKGEKEMVTLVTADIDQDGAPDLIGAEPDALLFFVNDKADLKKQRLNGLSAGFVDGVLLSDLNKDTALDLIFISSDTTVDVILSEP